MVYQVLNRFKEKERKYFDKLPVECREVMIAIPALDCDGLLVKRFKPEWMQKGKLYLLNQMVERNYALGYTKTLKPLIYNNVYYFEYGIAMASEYQRTKDVTWWELYKKCYDEYLKAKAEVKSSYTMALHISNVLIALDLFGEVVEEEFREKVYCELYSQYVYLQAHQEKHLFANHYFEDLKALIIGAYLFREDTSLRTYLKAFKKQCDEQVLADGVHYELSPMYHKLILEDLMRIGMLAKQPNFPECSWLIPLIQKMAIACRSLEKGMGRTPLFNDAGDNVAKTCEQLCLAAEQQFGVKAIAEDALPDSGYYKLYDGDRALIFDAGKIGVDYQPAHGHCDCLSFELSVDGEPLFVNQGTYEYQGDLRKYFRKTCAHNTVEINGHEQSQCWGAFRVGKRATRNYGKRSDGLVEGGYRNYCGEGHHRRVMMRNGIVEVMDTTKAKAGVSVKSYLHIAPGYKIEEGVIKDRINNVVCVVKPVGCKMEKAQGYELNYYTPEFGDLKVGGCLVFSWKADDEIHGYTIDFNV